MKKNHGRNIQKGEGNYRIKCTAIACLGGSAATFVLLMIFSVILSSYDLPLGVLQPMAVLAILITAPLGALGMDASYRTLLEQEPAEGNGR